MESIIGIFIILHGLVHLLYFAQSRRLFELQPGMTWPDGSWAFSRLLGNEITRRLACMVCVLASLGLIAGGMGILLEQEWWRPVAMVGAAISAAGYVLLWNGKMQQIDNQGLFGILIDLVILAAALILDFDF